MGRPNAYSDIPATNTVANTTIEATLAVLLTRNLLRGDHSSPISSASTNIDYRGLPLFTNRGKPIDGFVAVR